jgi:hypothetical protein
VHPFGAAREVIVTTGWGALRCGVRPPAAPSSWRLGQPAAPEPVPAAPVTQLFLSRPEVRPKPQIRIQAILGQVVADSVGKWRLLRQNS